MKIQTSFGATLAIVAVLTLAVTTPARAQTPEPASPGWEFEVTPYFWLAGLTGDIEAGGASGSISASFGDLVKSVDIALMGRFEARKGRWGFEFDAEYIKLSKEGTTPGALEQGVHAAAKTQYYSLALSYRIIRGRIPVDIVGGVRIMPLSVALEVTSGPLAGAEASASNTAVDGYLGASLALPLTGRLSLEAYGDVGTGDSKLSWQAQGNLNLKLSRSVTAKVGYRYLGINNETPNSRMKTGQAGLYFGVGFRL